MNIATSVYRFKCQRRILSKMGNSYHANAPSCNDASNRQKRLNGRWDMEDTSIEQDYRKLDDGYGQGVHNLQRI